MSMARVVITAVVLEGRSKSEVARDYGVSRRWVQVLVARYLAEGEAAFEPRSRRPHSPRRIGEDVEDAIVGLRKQLVEAGHDAGAETIAFHLRQQLGQHSGSTPSVATIWRVLSRRGFVTPQPHKRPRSSWRRFEAELPNECWQADITHWQLVDNRGMETDVQTDVEILDIIDDHSRLLTGATARAVFKAGDIVADLHAAMARYGRPERLLTDNGAVFTGHFRGRGWVALERELVALGIAHSRAKPYHPQTCGKVERLHQTLKNWLAHQPAVATVTDLQAQLDTFADYYNHHRPHRGVGRRTPATAWHARPRVIPARQGIQISEHFRVRKDRVDRDGKLTLRHASRLHHIGIGRRWAGTPVLMLIRDRSIRIITEETGELVRQLVLDPSRDYQPQPKG
ncbi:MAG TPA: IS481 family transposase [Actinophytocola sp.]|jgi:transposase InsO family protein|nr:IS481 family transposase [Actinophytocola sp.]